MNIKNLLQSKVRSFYLWFFNPEGDLVTFPANNVADEDHALQLAAEYGHRPEDLYHIEERTSPNRPKYCYY
jgi:hypothetical protein